MIARPAIRPAAQPIARSWAVFVWLVAWLAAAAPALAQGNSAEAVQVRAVAARSSVAPGDQIPVAIIFEVKPTWHIWAAEAQAKTLPGIASFDGQEYTVLTATVEPAASATAYAGSIQWPKAHDFKFDAGDGPQTFAAYEGTAVAYLPIVIAANAPAGTLKLKIVARVQSCNNSLCMGPADIEATVDLNVQPGVASVANEPDLFKGFDLAVFGSLSTAVAKPLKFGLFQWEFSLDTNAATFFPLLLLLAFCGGILLNFTPCVLPIIPLKIMGLSAAASGERRRTFLLGLAMSAGVVGFWLLLGVLLGTVKQFTQINQFFQYPIFTITVGVFIALMAVGMAGFYNIGLPQWVYAIEPKHETYGGSLIFGVMTAVLSTPCTAPLMGAAAAWAVTTNSAITVILVFLAIGLGMASPYMVLSAFPHLARKMPKTGPASDVLKQVMGLLLLGAAVYFIGAGVNSFLPDPAKVHWWLITIIGGAAGIWLVVRTLQIAKTRHNRFIFATVGCFIAIVSLSIAPLMTYEPLPWKRYSSTAVAAAMKSGDVIVLDFTAEWCINCKALEKAVLQSGSVVEVLTERGVALLKADVGTNEEANNRLHELGNTTIPLLVVLSSTGTEVFRSDAYTPQQVIDAVRKAQGRAVTTASGTN